MNFRTKAKKVAKGVSYFTKSNSHIAVKTVSRPLSSREYSFDSTQQSKSHSPKLQIKQNKKQQLKNSKAITNSLSQLQTILINERRKADLQLSSLKKQIQQRQKILIQLNKSNQAIKSFLVNRQQQKKQIYWKLAKILKDLGVNPTTILPSINLDQQIQTSTFSKEMNKEQIIVVQQMIIKKLLNKLTQTNKRI